LHGLNNSGIRVSLDNFGTGCASLASLLSMPFAELKIDRSFVAACRSDPGARKLVRATVCLARELRWLSPRGSEAKRSRACYATADATSARAAISDA
jgi:predicted signal transduction protein with EAL and GGDEF domain